MFQMHEQLHRDGQRQHTVRAFTREAKKEAQRHHRGVQHAN